MEQTKKQPRIPYHWGVYDLDVEGERVVGVQPASDDPDPSTIGMSIPSAVHHQTRISQPMVREGWLKRNSSGAQSGLRGHDSFIPVSWDEALELVTNELRSIKENYGNEAIYAGSYGWGSAGQFHRPQGHLSRLLSSFGGHVASVDSYSSAAYGVVFPHIFGGSAGQYQHSGPSWPVIAESTELVVMFGGIPLKNAQVALGGTSKHSTRGWLQHCRDRGVDFVNVSPLKDDAESFLDAEWIAPHPGTDTALMLGIAHTLLAENIYDKQFVQTHCAGFDKFLPYLTGKSDGQPKSDSWAANICGIPTETIRSLARRMASSRTFINVSYSLQRGDHGEQPIWMAAVLGAMLGQIGLPGGGVGYGYGAFSEVGNPIKPTRGVSLPRLNNPVATYIPVARITDMLLNPGGKVDYNGNELTYPDIKFVYWAGGNPYHHHQDLNRLAEAWQRPNTIVVQDPWWTATARHADIVLPATTAAERNDIGSAPYDPVMYAMKQAIPPVGEARNDYDICAAIAERLGLAEEVTEGRSEMEWIEHLYGEFRERVNGDEFDIPEFKQFWEDGRIDFPTEGVQPDGMAGFRDDPVANPLHTPSGKIEIFSETVASFRYDDCPGHPVWIEPVEWLGDGASDRYPLHLISNQPKTRLHSQMDPGSTSVSSKIGTREAMTIHPGDAAARGIADGDILRVFNDRGECLVGARVSSSVRSGVVILPTGAWYDPESPGGIERHGNPNVLTLDKGTSRLAQGSIAQTTLVQVERFEGELPRVMVHQPPEISGG